MPHQFVVGAFEPGDDDMGDFLLDIWLDFAVNSCNWVANRAPSVGTRPEIEVWTHRGTVGTPASPYFFGHTKANSLHMFSGDDVDLAEEIYDQPNNPANAPRDGSFSVPATGNVGNTMKCLFTNDITGPYQGYWLFADTTGEYIHCVIKVSARHYRHFHIGRLRQIDGGVDLDPESFYATCHFWGGVEGGVSWPTTPSADEEHGPYLNHSVLFRNFGGVSTNGAFGIAQPNTIPGAHLYMPGLYPIQVSAVSVNDGGTGHADDDIITVSLTDGVYAGTGTPATLRVTGHTGGVIDTVSIETVGNYDRATGDGNTNPVTDIDQASSTGSGVAAVFDLTFEGYKFFKCMPHDGLEVTGSPTAESIGGVMRRSRIGCAQSNYHDGGLGSMLWACDRNFTANANVLVPIYISVAFDFQSDIRQGVVATVPDMFRINMRDYSPEETITVQGNDYKVFPLANNDSANTVADEPYSGYEGIAYRVETGAVV